MVEVVALDPFTEWYLALDEADTGKVNYSVALLEQMGVTLGHPHSSQIKGTTIGMRELRVQAQGRPLRILYVFDPKRQAILILGGDKTGDDRWYEENVPAAERLYREYLAEQE